MKSKVIYLLPVIAVIILAILLYAKSEQLLGRVDLAMLKSRYTTYCINAELDLDDYMCDNCDCWANMIVFTWPDAAQECSDSYRGNVFDMSMCTTAFMMEETFIGNGD